MSQVDQEPPTFGRFFLPGPTEVRPEVLAAQSRPMIGHRGESFENLMQELQVGLKEVFLTARPVFVSSSSATGLMEAAIRNGATGRVLSLVNGAFSGRFAHIARACGLEVDELAVPWGEANDPVTLGEALSRAEYDAITVVHSETSTGVLNPIEELASIARNKADTLLLVDSVTGIGGAEVRTDEWGLDFVLTGSQKALALPPGLAFGVASERMMERSADICGKGFYFDFVVLEKYLRKLQTPSTPALSLLRSLEVQLRFIREEGMERRWARHAALAEKTWTWVERMREDRGVALRVIAPPGCRSPTVTAIALPHGHAGSRVVTAMRERGWVIGGGYGELKETSIRIGHMGDHSGRALKELLDTLEEVLDGG